MGIHLCVICCFSLAAFNICSLCLIFVNLINMCLGVFCLCFHCFCIHSASLCLLVGAFKPFTFKLIIDKLIPFPFTLLFWVRVYIPFLCLLSREDPLAFVSELVWGAEFSQLLLVCKAFDFSFIFE